MSFDPKLVQEIAAKVLRQLEGEASAQPSLAGGDMGSFADVASAIAAAEKAFAAFRDIGFERRGAIIEQLRAGLRLRAEDLARMSVAETNLGRVADKIQKNLLVTNKTPGTEALVPLAASGQHGLTIEEHAPYGVIGAITPCTNPTETVINNGIGMIAAGNAVVFNAHPSAKKSTAAIIDIMNRLLVAAGAPANLVTGIKEPTIATANELMRAPGIRLLVVTGGPAVVQAAFAAGKKVIAAGPGNPPVVVDETADIEQAGKGIVDGASFDNNVVCICEKEVIAVNAIADSLKAAMTRAGAYELKGPELLAVQRLVLDGDHPHKNFVGRNADHILKSAGIAVPNPAPRLLFAEVPFDHPFIQLELLMPVIGLTRAANVDDAIELARRAEHGYRHTAGMYSKNIDNLHKMARVMDCSIFVKNGPHYNGVGFEGSGHTSFTIASPTGEGLTTARDFTRLRRCVLKDHFRIV